MISLILVTKVLLPDRRVTPHRCFPLKPASFSEHIQGKLNIYVSCGGKSMKYSYFWIYTCSVSLQIAGLFWVLGHDLSSLFSSSSFCFWTFCVVRAFCLLFPFSSFLPFFGQSSSSPKVSPIPEVKLRLINE